jgi:hypothetical protein
MKIKFTFGHEGVFMKPDGHGFHPTSVTEFSQEAVDIVQELNAQLSELGLLSDDIYPGSLPPGYEVS